MTRSRTLRLITCLFVGAAVSTLAGCSTNDASNEADYLAHLSKVTGHTDAELIDTGYEVCEGDKGYEDTARAVKDQYGLINGARVFAASYISLCPEGIPDEDIAGLEARLAILEDSVSKLDNLGK